MSYHVSTEETVRNAAELIRAGAQCVKLEGGRKRIPMIDALIDAEIPVMGHLGLTPQSMHAMGGFKVQAKESEAALALVADAKALAHAGCFAIVLEGVPDEVARMVTDAVDVPTIGIGAGPRCDGQVLVFHDLLGLEDRTAPKFVRRYAGLKESAVEAMSNFVVGRPLRGVPRGRRELPPERGAGRGAVALRRRRLSAPASAERRTGKLSHPRGHCCSGPAAWSAGTPPGGAPTLIRSHLSALSCRSQDPDGPLGSRSRGRKSRAHTRVRVDDHRGSGRR